MNLVERLRDDANVLKGDLDLLGLRIDLETAATAIEDLTSLLKECEKFLDAYIDDEHYAWAAYELKDKISQAVTSL